MGKRGTISRRLREFARVILVTTLLATTAHADGAKTAFLIDRLKADDFRVRTNAALALGASNDDAAVDPLCGALSDDNDVVRQAVGAALKRLARTASLPCLRERLEKEPQAAVKASLARAIEAIAKLEESPSDSGGGAIDLTKPNPNAKYYVALSNVQNRTDKPQAEVESLVMSALQERMGSIGTFQVAPPKESAAAAKKAIGAKKLKGLYLSISVDPFDGGKARVRVAIFSYPNKDLKGEVSGKASASQAMTALPAAAQAAVDMVQQAAEQL